MPRTGPYLLLGTFAALLWLENRRPLRRRSRPQPERLIGNLLFGTAAALAVALVESPVAQPLARAVQRHRLGLVPRLGLPAAGELTLSLLLLDYSLYRWHVLLHRLPMLWRWHRVHHADADLDVSTALRFHAAEMICSVPWRLGQILLIGVSPRTLELWSRLTLAEVMFHHANFNLPERFERVLGRILMTPRQHGIHHANTAAQQHTNLSSGLTIWDLLSGTAGDYVPQDKITIGLPAEDEKR